MAIGGGGGGVPSTKGLPVVKNFANTAPTQNPSAPPFAQNGDSSSYSIINARRVAAAAVLLAASSGLFMPPVVPPAAASTSVGIPLQSGGAPPRINRVYYQARFEPPYVAPAVQAIPIEMGGQLPQTRSVYYQTRSEPPALSTVANVTLGKWQSPLSVAPGGAKAQPGFASVPFDTAQAVVTPPSEIGIPLFSGGASPRVNRVYYQTRSEPPYVAPVVVATYTDLFLQPLSTAPPVAIARSGFGSVPFNTAQLSVCGWQQALSAGPPPVRARYENWQLPYYGRPTAGNVAWLSPLSLAPTAAATQPDFGSVPPYALQASPVGIAGMAWFTPLWTAPTRNLVAQPGSSFVPFDATQQIVVTTPGKRRPILFIANVGRLMN